MLKLNKLRTGGLWATCLIPALVLLGLIIHYAVNVPVTDQYALIPIFRHLDKGQLVFNDFWAQHNEHRIFFPTIFLTILAEITHWNTLAEIYACFIIACAGFCAIVSLARRHIKTQKLRIVAVFLSAVFFFSPVQWENWLWGWQLEWFMCVGCMLWSINLIDALKIDDRLRKLTLPLLLGVIASFSLGGGTLVWVAGFIILISKRLRRNVLIAWAGTAVLSLGLYYFHYHKPENGLSSTSFLHDIPTYAKYVVAYIGRPISDNPQTAILAGLYTLVIFMALVGYLLYRRKFPQLSLASLGIITLLTGFITVAARFDLGIAVVSSSRYTTFSLLLIISIILLVLYLVDQFLIAKQSDADSIALVVILIIVIPAIAFSWNNGLKGMKEHHKLYNNIYQCSRYQDPTYICLYQIYFPSTKIAKDGLNYLKQKHYSGY